MEISHLSDLVTEFHNIHAINWHDQRTEPSLGEARKDINGGLLGGLSEMDVIRNGSEKEITESIKQVYKEFDGRGLIFAPGCVLPIEVSDEKIQQVIKTINSLFPI